MGWVDGLYLAESRDNGRSWSKPVKLKVPGFEDVATSEPILELRSGTLLLPFYASRSGRKSGAACLVSSDGGQTWDKVIVMASDPENRTAFQEPSLVELTGGRTMSHAH
jgi:BNR repeat-like domain